jgi:hypothetical protein
VVDSYEYYGQHVEHESESDEENAYINRKKVAANGVISGEQIIENSEKKKAQQVKGSNKKTNIEVLDEEMHIQ